MKKFKEHIKSDIAKYKDLLSNPDIHREEFINIIHRWDDLEHTLGSIHSSLKDYHIYGVGDTEEEERDRQEAIEELRAIATQTEKEILELEKDFLDKFKPVLDFPHNDYKTLPSIARRFEPHQAFRYFFKRGER